MTSIQTEKPHRPLYTLPLLWGLVIFLGVINIIVQRVRSDGFIDFFTQSAWQWPELAIGAVTLILVTVLVASFVRTRIQGRASST